MCMVLLKQYKQQLYKKKTVSSTNPQSPVYKVYSFLIE